MRIAFYKGEQTGFVGAYGKFQKRFDSGEFTHCEIIFSDGMAASSSLRDKGVRFKKIDFHPDRWVFIDVSWADEEVARQYFTKWEGTPYDSVGNITFAFGFIRGSKDKLFCSEALGLKEGWRYSPNGLYQILSLMSKIHFNNTQQCKGTTMLNNYQEDAFTGGGNPKDKPKDKPVTPTGN